MAKVPVGPDLGGGAAVTQCSDFLVVPPVGYTPIVSYRSRLKATCGALLICAALLAPSTAHANRVLDDWRADGSIDGTYTVGELQSARGSVSPEELEYSDFDIALRAAIARSARRQTSSSTGGSGSTSGGSSSSDDTSTDATGGESKKKSKKPKGAKTTGEKASDSSDRSLSAAGANSSGKAGNKTDDDSSPVPLLLLLGVLSVGGVAGGLWWRGRRGSGA